MPLFVNLPATIATGIHACGIDISAGVWNVPSPLPRSTSMESAGKAVDVGGGDVGAAVVEKSPVTSVSDVEVKMPAESNRRLSLKCASAVAQKHREIVWPSTS